LEHTHAMELMAAEKYVLGELHDDDREQFEEHFFSCADCAQDVRDLSAITHAAKDLLKPEPSQKRATAGWLPRWIFPGAGVDPFGRLAWAGALLVLLGVAGFENLELRRGVRPQAVASILVHPESRGEATPVPVQRIGSLLLLEADLPGSSGKLQWDLRKADSKNIIVQDAADSPPAGESFKVILESSFLAPAEYTLTVRPVTMAPEKTWLFRFKVAQNLR
jgi:hypothetical protein